MLFDRNIPQFFDSNTKNLWTALVSKAEYLGQSLGEMAARRSSARTACISGVKLNPLLIVGPMTAVAGNAHVAGLPATPFTDPFLR